MKINLNTLLLVLAGLGVFAPDIASVATWLASMHIAWLGTVVKGLGLLAAFCSAAPLVVPRLRAFLALLGLATPPGARAPWIPGKDDVTPVVTSKLPQPSPTSKVLALLVLAGSLLLGGTAVAQTPVPQLGWCSADGQTCIGPSLAVTLTRVTADGKVQGGINPGVCYGLTRNPAEAWAYGVDGCLAFALNGDGLGANVLSPALLFKINKFRAGVSAQWTQTPGEPVSRIIGFAFGGGFDIQSLTQSYSRKQLAEAASAGK